MNRRKSRGFALPTVLISSIIMLMVLVSAISYTSATRTLLTTQYYNQLSTEAADAGIEYAKACIAAEPTKTAQWTNDKPLKVNSDCGGNITTACADNSIDSNCSVIVTNNNKVTASFSVPQPTKDSDNKYPGISATGLVTLLRSNDSSIWRQYKQTTTSSLYSELNGTLPIIGTPIADCTWKQIRLIAEAGLGDDYFNIGDSKDLTLTTGETLTMQIYDFNHDDKSDGSGKTNITFGTKNLMANKRAIDLSTDTNSYGWDGTDIRGWMNGISTTRAGTNYISGNTSLYSQLPSIIQTSIKQVNKMTYGGSTNNTLVTSADKLFLFSQVETLGSNPFSMAGEGTQYPIFTNDASRIKKLSNGAGVANYYWGRSPYSGLNTSFTMVYDTGNYGNSGASSTSVGVAFGFAIGNAPKYSVVFNSQGGSDVTSQSVEIGKKITEPTVPTKSGSVFAGWYKEASYINAWNFSNDTVTTNTTLYAKWIEMPAVGTPLESFTWDQIAYISEHGQADTYFDIGDTKNITLSTNEVLTMQVYDFNHDDKSDSSGKAGITFGTKDLMATTSVNNSTPTNAGGWQSSEIRSWANSTLYSKIPSNITNAIKPINKSTGTGNWTTSGTILSSDKIFIFSEVELWGVANYSVPGEGSKYPIFTDNNSRIKKLSNGAGSAYNYWTRSHQSGDGLCFNSITSTGGITSNGASNNYGVNFGFAI